jgi:hypothetical protein
MAILTPRLYHQSLHFPHRRIQAAEYSTGDNGMANV